MKRIFHFIHSPYFHTSSNQKFGDSRYGPCHTRCVNIDDLYIILYIALIVLSGVNMNYREIRVKSNFTDLELAMLFAVPVKNIRAWENELGEPDDSTKALYLKLNDSDLAFDIFKDACTRKYESAQDIKLLLQMTDRFSTDYLLRGMLQVCLATSNPQFKPEDLGFKVTRINK